MPMRPRGRTRPDKDTAQPQQRRVVAYYRTGALFFPKGRATLAVGVTA
jgi:hypothetical protein